MTTKELNIIESCISNTKNAIINTAWETYPYGKACDEDLEKMYHDLIRMEILLTKKITKIRTT